MDAQLKQICFSYARVQNEIKTLEDRKTKLGEKIMQSLEELGAKKLALTAIGTFSIGERKLWEYTAFIADLELKLKKAQKEQQKSGDAKCSVKKYLRYQAK